MTNVYTTLPILDKDIHKRQDPPIERHFEVSLDKLFSGGTQRFNVTRKKRVANGNFENEVREVTVTIPPGTKAGTKFTFSRLGDENPGVIPADIAFILRDKPHRHFKRDMDNNLHYTARISRQQAHCGCTINIPLIEDTCNSVPMRVHAGAQSGMKQVIPGKGMPNHKGPSHRESLIVLLDVEIPTMTEFLSDHIDFWYLNQ